MPSSDLSFTISVLVPILFIVVVEIARFSRDIGITVTHQREPTHRYRIEPAINNLLTLLPKFQRGQPIPAFGHFGTLHAVNVTLLLYGVAVVNYGLTGAGRFILTMSVLIILYLLPIIEVREYHEIRQKGINPISHKIHGVGSFVIGTFAGGLGEAYSTGMPLWLILIFGVIFVLAPMAVISAYFSLYLERELDSTTPGR